MSRRGDAISDGTPPKGRLGLLLFGGFFAIFGGFFVAVFFILPLWRVAQARDWVSVPCTIQASSVKESHSSDGSTYRVEVVFEYRFSGGIEIDTHGRALRSSRYDLSDGVYSSGRASKQAIVDSLPPGAQATCWVDPRHPDQAVLVRAMTGVMWFGAITLIFPAMGVLVIVLGLRARRKAAFGGDAPFAGAPDDRLAGGMSIGAGAGFEPVASPASDGPVDLVPISTRGMKLTVAVVMAVIWNAIVGLIGTAIGSGDGIGLAFLSIFGLVGIGLIGAVVYLALAFTNPRVRLTIDRRFLHRGERFTLSWECAGASSRMRSLAFLLEGVEVATYRRGTSTSTDQRVFARIPIAKLEDRGDMLAGRAEVRIPEAAMHSFSSSNNKILWRLAVRGDIPRWPDIGDDYAITILPSPIPVDGRQPAAQGVS